MISNKFIKTIKNGESSNKSEQSSESYMLNFNFFQIQHIIFILLFYNYYLLLMQPTTPVEQRANYPITRERPLQKSLFLPDHFSPQNHNAPKSIPPIIPDFMYNPMKKSSTTITENGSPISINSSQYGSNFNITANSGPSSATIIPQYTLDQRAQSQHELFHHPGTNSLKNLNTMVRSNVISEADNKNFYKEKRQNFELKINSTPVNSEPIDIQQIINQVVLQIKQKHLPNMIRSIKKELYDDLHHLRVQFQTFKDQVKMHEAESQEMLAWYKNNQKNMENCSKKDQNQNKNTKSPRKEQPQVQWMEAQFFALQQRLNQYQSKVYESINHLNAKFQNEFKERSPKISSLKSTFTPYCLEYRESLAVSNLQKTYPEITISQSTYYIDKQGFLLDNQSHYLLDNRGIQIKMEEKHIKLLQQHKILCK